MNFINGTSGLGLFRKLNTFNFIVYFSGIFIILITRCTCDNDVCDRRPLGTKAEALRPDNQFVLEVDKIKDNKYIPNEKYTGNYE